MEYSLQKYQRTINNLIFIRFLTALKMTNGYFFEIKKHKSGVISHIAQFKHNYMYTNGYCSLLNCYLDALPFFAMLGWFILLLKGKLKSGFCHRVM